MTDVITLTLRAIPDRRVDIDAIAPDHLFGLSDAAIASLPARLSYRMAPDPRSATVEECRDGARGPLLGDLFAISRGAGARGACPIRVVGDLRRIDGLGSGMTAGTLVIDGDVGREVGRGMTGGTIEIRGSAGDGLGRAMAGGSITVFGRGGDCIGGPLPGGSRGMTGGEIVVRGDAGRDAGFCARRGLIAIGGNADDGVARGMIAGTVVVMGRAVGSVGLWNKRGTVVALGGAQILASYRYACTYRPSFIGLLLGHLRRTHRLSVDDRFLQGRYARHCGDFSELGLGEVLTWVDHD